MIIFINNKSTKFCQITLHMKTFIHKRKLVPFFCLTVMYTGSDLLTRDPTRLGRWRFLNLSLTVYITSINCRKWSNGPARRAMSRALRCTQTWTMSLIKCPRSSSVKRWSSQILAVLFDHWRSPIYYSQCPALSNYRLHVNLLCLGSAIKKPIWSARMGDVMHLRPNKGVELLI